MRDFPTANIRPDSNGQLLNDRNRLKGETDEDRQRVNDICRQAAGVYPNAGYNQIGYLPMLLGRVLLSIHREWVRGTYMLAAEHGVDKIDDEFDNTSPPKTPYGPLF